MSKQAVIVHSGGMDSSLCLALALREFPKEKILSLSFNYDQRNHKELQAAQKICQQWGVDNVVVDLSMLGQLTRNALTNHSLSVTWNGEDLPPSLVVGRNGLMARLAAIHAHQLGAHCIYMGVMEVETLYRDCSEDYIKLNEQILRLDLDDPTFEIRTPLIKLRKEQTLELAESLGVLEFLLENTITCYEGIGGTGCKECYACFLRNRGIEEYTKKKSQW
jgi:7-cyano-7-deazaguanine synthase